ncbi:MAG: hypothetical protein IPM54_37490 [Polyangiaceae bacterium]|nr:hypothetical protein [Polyangiaceae bacterium]
MTNGASETSFRDRLEVTLELTIAGEAFSIAGGDIKYFEIEILPYGIFGQAEFWFVANTSQSEDTLFSAFVGTDVIDVSLTCKRERDQEWGEATPMTVKGLVSARSVEERAFDDVSGKPVLQRKYAIHFADRGSVLWRQHHPTALYVDKTMKDLVEDNKPAGVTIKYPWTAATTQYAVRSLGLGVSGNDASFYDFLMWFLDKENLGLHYDSAADDYSIVSEKPDGGSAKTLQKEEIALVEAYFPEVRRDVGNVLNAYTDAATKKKGITNAESVTGVRTDHLIRSAIENDTTSRATLETGRSKQRQPEAVVFFKSFPTTPVVWPNQAKLDTAYGTNVYQSGKTYRVRRTRIVAWAVSQEATDDNAEAANAYMIEHEIDLELAADVTFRRAAFVAPVWPYHVEGKVKSETGEETEETYQIYQDASSQDVYRVKVPLFDDTVVIAPFLPYYQPGHFYFPAYRDQRVLLELYFDRAFVRSFLDFRPGGRLAAESQGNHLLMGKTATDQTSIRHLYEEQKPKLVIERTKDKDWQMITVSEGVIRMETQDKE